MPFFADYKNALEPLRELLEELESRFTAIESNQTVLIQLIGKERFAEAAITYLRKKAKNSPR